MGLKSVKMRRLRNQASRASAHASARVSVTCASTFQRGPIPLQIPVQSPLLFRLCRSTPRCARSPRSSNAMRCSRANAPAPRSRRCRRGGSAVRHRARAGASLPNVLPIANAFSGLTWSCPGCRLLPGRSGVGGRAHRLASRDRSALTRTRWPRSVCDVSRRCRPSRRAHPNFSAFCNGHRTRALAYRSCPNGAGTPRRWPRATARYDGISIRPRQYDCMVAHSRLSPALVPSSSAKWR
jgi:hypothetical protein